MKIAIATVQIPFVKGGAEFLAANLQTELIRRGNEAEIVSIPFNDRFPHLIENQIIASRLLDASCSWGGQIDLCIGLKFPAYFIPHPNKVCWVLHQYRQSYDLFNTAFSMLKDNETGHEVREIVRRADSQYLSESKRIYTIARNVSDRLMKYNQIPSVPLYHPCPDMEKFYNLDYEDYILMPSRISPNKRQGLAVEAMQYVRGNIRLVILGRPDNETVLRELTDAIREYHLESRVQCIGFVDQEEKLKLYARARAILFIPMDEDYGYITIEAMAASKAVITARDSGGPLEFQIDHVTGFVAEPTAKDIAKAIDSLAESPGLAKKMGAAGKAHLEEMELSWDHVIKELTREK